MRRILQYEIEEEKTIERFLKENLGFSKRQVSALKFREDGIMVEQVRRRVSHVLKRGEHLTLTVEEDGCSDQIVPLYEPPRILYEDADVLVADKPAGILVHPAGGHYGDTLTNQIAAYFLRKGERTVLRPVGRLDKDTSGAVLFAKNRMAAARLSKRRGDGGLEKEYLALVHGVPEPKSGRLDAPIGPWRPEKALPSRQPDRDRAEASLRMQVDFENGKAAGTTYELLRDFGDCSLLRVKIATGRTHQIRVHMAYLGHPLLGDPLYGEEGGNHGFTRAALHAERMTFCRPFGGERMEICAPLPGDFTRLLNEEEKRDGFDNTLLY